MQEPLHRQVAESKDLQTRGWWWHLAIGEMPHNGGLPCSVAKTPLHRRLVLAATILGSSMAFIDGTVVNIALPALQATMGATISDVQWVVEAYTLFVASLMLTGGALGDRFGRKRIFAIGVAGFTAGSVACGLAPTMSAPPRVPGLRGSR